MLNISVIIINIPLERQKITVKSTKRKTET